jgi:DNA repair photolyase
MFYTIKKFTDAGINCGVNIDPILPLITDSEEEIESIVDNCNKSGVGYVFGAVLRLRADIWQRMKIILKLLDLNDDGIEVYKNRIYQFTEPLNSSCNNITANESYSNKVLYNLKNKVSEKGMSFDFPEFIGDRRIIKENKKKENSNNNHHYSDGNKNNNKQQQITLMTYM